MTRYPTSHRHEVESRGLLVVARPGLPIAGESQPTHRSISSFCGLMGLSYLVGCAVASGSMRAHRIVIASPKIEMALRMKTAFIAAACAQVAGRKADKTRWLADFYDTARSSVALPIDGESAAIRMFRVVLEEYQQLRRRQKALDFTA